MRHIGLVGGLSPESTIEYYKIICEEYNHLAGRLHFPVMTMRSLDLQQIADLMGVGDWDGVADTIVDAIKDLHRAGADFAAIATNTPHNAIERIQERSPIEVLSIADATAMAIQRDGIHTVGLLGTRPTMEYGFFQKAFRRYGIETITPPEQARLEIDNIIWTQLVKGQILEESRRAYLRTIDDLAHEGAQGVVLGCTEIPLLVRQQDTSIKTYNTTDIHARAILEYAMNDE